jgi:hypothetical protein
VIIRAVDSTGRGERDLEYLIVQSANRNNRVRKFELHVAKGVGLEIPVWSIQIRSSRGSIVQGPGPTSYQIGADGANE